MNVQTRFAASFQQARRRVKPSFDGTRRAWIEPAAVSSRELQFEDRSMRFLLMLLATAALGSACKKDPALSNTTSQVSPPSTTGAIAPAANAEGSGSGAPVPSAQTAPASAQSPRPAMPAVGDEGPTAEGNGEPMDDVDDEVVPVTDKSGVDNAKAEDEPTGPLDEDPEGADIDVRE
jgi:hypothetical protein